MNKEDVLGAFLLVNNPIVLSEEEIKDVQKAIKQLQQENKKLNGTIQTYDILLKSNIEENKQLQERIEYLERSNNRREDIIIEQRQEISDLEDNWDELKEYAKEIISTDNELYGTDLLNKMQEIEKGDDSNE